MQLPLVPKYVAGGNLTWQRERWTHYVEARYNSSMLLSSLTTSPAVVQASYTVLNLSTTYRLDKNVDLSASVVNLFDRRYSDGSANNPQSIMVALPRAVTLGLRARF